MMNAYRTWRLNRHPLVKALREEGPDARGPFFDNPVLDVAIRDNEPPAVIRKLLEMGASRTYPSVERWQGLYPPLHYIAYVRTKETQGPELTRMLVTEFGFDVNERFTPLGWHPVTALGLALERGNQSVAKTLVVLGADPNDPSLDALRLSPEAREFLAKLRHAHKTVVGRKETLIKEAITRHAEATPLDETGRRMTGIPPGVPGPDIVKQFLTKKGGRKSTRRHLKVPSRHRKKTRRHRR